MKSGDMVKLKGSHHSGELCGVLVQRWGLDNPGWWEVLIGKEVVHWPERQLVLVSSQSKS